MIEPDSIRCPCGCGDMVRIGEDRSERLDIVPAQLRVIVTIRPRYACPKSRAGVGQARAPAYLLEGALPTEALLAHVIVSKYSEHLPLYRQAQVFARHGVALDRSTLADWVGRASWHLAPVVERMAEHLKRSGKLFMDETAAPVLDPGRGRTKTGFSGRWRATIDHGAAAIRPRSCSPTLPAALPAAAAPMPSRSSTASTASCRSTGMRATGGSPTRGAGAIVRSSSPSAGRMPDAK